MNVIVHEYSFVKFEITFFWGGGGWNGDLVDMAVYIHKKSSKNRSLLESEIVIEFLLCKVFEMQFFHHMSIMSDPEILAFPHLEK